MITREQGIHSWASKWHALRAWRRDLSDVKVTVSDRAFPDRLGTCWPTQQRVVVYKGASFVDELGTLLHELAHAATIDQQHSPAWQATFAAAVTEVTGIAVTPSAYNYRVLNMAAKDAFRTWWHASGNDRLWRLAHTGRL